MDFLAFGILDSLHQIIPGCKGEKKAEKGYEIWVFNLARESPMNFIHFLLYVHVFCFLTLTLESKEPGLLQTHQYHSIPMIYREKGITLDPTPYILPQNHPLRPILEKIFSNPNVLKNEDTLEKAGFPKVSAQKLSLVRVLPHPLVKGYLFKLYLESETHHKYPYSNQEWLIQRCIGAEKIRKLIKAHKIRFLNVPDKWLFEIPSSESHPERKRLFVLVAKRMNILNKQGSELAWKTKISKKHLDELYYLMKNGCGSTMLSVNIPYTKEGKFSLIDTEYPDRPINLPSVEHFFSKEMQTYWERLIKKH